MSWIVENKLSWLQKFCINVLKCGPIPRHVAFIMDGNRRYATKANVKKAEGHSKGFEKLAECLQWCKELGVTEVTVYAFSIENFKRSEEEVETLMNLAREKFQKLLNEEEKIMKEGVKVKVMGNLSLLPDDLKKLIAKVVLLTANNSKCTLNIAFSYTSRDEVTRSIQIVIEGVETNQITVDHVNEYLITQCLQSSSSPDMLIRTSGEIRLSDFLLWQISNTEIYFADVLWPEFNIWHLLACVFKYQRSVYNNSNLNEDPIENHDERVEMFLKNVKLKEEEKFVEFVKS